MGPRRLRLRSLQEEDRELGAMVTSLAHVAPSLRFAAARAGLGCRVSMPVPIRWEAWTSTRHPMMPSRLVPPWSYAHRFFVRSISTLVLLTAAEVRDMSRSARCSGRPWKHLAESLLVRDGNRTQHSGRPWRGHRIGAGGADLASWDLGGGGSAAVAGRDEAGAVSAGNSSPQGERTNPNRRLPHPKWYLDGDAVGWDE